MRDGARAPTTGQRDDGDRQRHEEPHRERGEVLGGVGPERVDRAEQAHGERAVAHLEVHLVERPRAGELPDDERREEVGDELPAGRSGRRGRRAATATRARASRAASSSRASRRASRRGRRRRPAKPTRRSVGKARSGAAAACSPRPLPPRAKSSLITSSSGGVLDREVASPAAARAPRSTTRFTASLCTSRARHALARVVAHRPPRPRCRARSVARLDRPREAEDDALVGPHPRDELVERAVVDQLALVDDDDARAERAARRPCSGSSG